jgi:RimJ/RimL family protein N-acetyltransferase/acyl carrier protein
MTPQDSRRLVLDTVHDLAPEADLGALDPARALREQIDLDSLDWTNLVEALGDRLEIALPAHRVPAAATLDELVAVVASARRRTGQAGAAHHRTGAPRVLRRARLADGRRVTLRPICAADAPREAAFVRGLSALARYKRFMLSLHELPPAKLAYFTDVDQVRHIALAAWVTGDRRRVWVGVARSIADPQGDGCEFAVTVGDDWQGSGLAGVLMHALMRAARIQGCKTMRGSVLAANAPMLALARRLGFTASRDEPGTVQVQRAL